MTPLEYLQTMTAKTKRPKYGNVRIKVDGVVFDSLAEARRFGELRILEKAGEISELELQPGFRLEVNGRKICDYRGDFAFIDKKGRKVVEDVKSKPTATLRAFRLKAKLFRALFGYDITIVAKGAK